jgi:hypothetical protein
LQLSLAEAAEGYEGADEHRRSLAQKFTFCMTSLHPKSLAARCTNLKTFISDLFPHYVDGKGTSFPSFLASLFSIMAFISQLLLVLALTYSTVLGASSSFTTNWNPNGDGCVDTKGFLSCYQTEATKGTNCLNSCASNDQNCVDGCTGFWLASNVGCWLQSCWNQVRLIE